jgi:hypothetical protein
LLLTLVVVLFASCAQPFDFDFEDSGQNDGGNVSQDPTQDPVPITIASDSFTLAWNPADGDVEAYEVFFRDHGSEDWTHLTDVAATDTPRFTVDTGILSHGSYDFAVRSRVSGGQTSEYHTSLDSTADPDSGWWVEWTSG